MESDRTHELCLKHLEDSTKFLSSVSPACFDTIRAHVTAQDARIKELERQVKDLKASNQSFKDNFHNSADNAAFWMREYDGLKARVNDAIRVLNEKGAQQAATVVQAALDAVPIQEPHAPQA